MSKTPKQLVDERFQSREKLIDALIPLLEDKDSGTKTRLKRTSNAKLLSLHRAASEVRERFRSKKRLIEEIVALNCPGGHADKIYLERLNSYSVKRLLDLHRQHSVG